MLIDRIKEDRLLAMKARDEVKKNLLGTLVAAATKDGKAPDDAAVLKTIRLFLKSLDETAGLLEARGLDTGVQRAERAILSAYLPQTLGEEPCTPASSRSWPAAGTFAQSDGSGDGGAQGPSRRRARQQDREWSGPSRAGVSSSRLLPSRTVMRNQHTSNAMVDSRQIVLSALISVTS